LLLYSTGKGEVVSSYYFGRDEKIDNIKNRLGIFDNKDLNVPRIPKQMARTGSGSR